MNKFDKSDILICVGGLLTLFAIYKSVSLIGFIAIIGILLTSAGFLIGIRKK